MSRIAATWALLTLVLASAASAQTLQAVQPIGGYACMMLNLSPAEMRDNSVAVPIYAQPSASSRPIGNASALVIATSPLRVVSGFGQVLTLRGETGWLPVTSIRPYHAANPAAHCTPSWMSNGRPGFG